MPFPGPDRGSGVEMTRVFTLDDTNAILDTFQTYGHNEVDTARVYGEGSSEEYLGNLGWQKRGLIMDTKLYPTSIRPSMAKEHYSHSPEDLRAGLMASLKALKTDKLEMWYLHGPDRGTPFQDTLREVNKLHEGGFFKRFGISNYYSWEVAKMCDICQQNGWIMPT
jgi:aflatoxin B1 aldehyde reductase